MRKPEDIYFLVGCEESQAITIELRKLGIQAFSCDLKPCSGGHPEWHLQMDVFKAIEFGFKTTQAGTKMFVDCWDGAIFHPECRYLTVSGLHWNGRVPGRAEKTEKALQFVCDLLNCGIEYIRLENPIGCISTRIFWYVGGESGKAEYKVFPRKLENSGFKPSEIVQPYQFGEDASKATCFWNIGFPILKINPDDYFPPRITEDGKKRWGNQTDSGQNKLGPSPERTELRSKTYPGIARAIANQSVQFLLNQA